MKKREALYKTQAKPMADRFAMLLAITVALVTSGAWAAALWTGAGSDELFTTTGNWAANPTYNIVFNNDAQAVTSPFIRLNADYTSPFKVPGDSNDARRSLIFRQLPEGSTEWFLCGWHDGIIHKYHLGATSGTDGSLVVGDNNSTRVRLSAIDMTVTAVTVGGTGEGELILDTCDKDGTTYRGPVTLKSLGDFRIEKGTVSVNDGTIEVPSGKWTHFSTTGDSTLNLNGGTFITKHINRNSEASATVNFNGGTLKANAAYASNGGLIQAGVTVKVNNGGIIDNGGYDITISPDIDYTSSGDLIFTGTGTTTLATATLYGIDAVLNDGGLSMANDLYVTKSMTVNGGTAEVPTGKWTRLENGGSQLNLNGGVFKTKHIQGYSGGTLNFNGGTLRANETYDSANFGGLIAGDLTINVNSGTIDSGNYAIFIDKTLGGVGGLTFTGGNTITIRANVSYSGATVVTPGTILAVANASAKSNILSHGLVVGGVPTAGQTVFTYTEALTGDDLANVTCSLAPATTFKIGDDGMSIVVDTVGATINYWTGAAGDNNLGNAANWSGNAVPADNANIFCTVLATLTKGAGFAPTAITFIAGSSAVTIDGDAFSGIVAITNNSSVSHTINAPVHFAGNIQVKQAATAETGDLSKAHVTFAGGAFAAAGCALESGSSEAVYSRCIFGKYHLASTAASRWEAPYQGSSKRRVCVADGSSLYIPYAGSLKELYVGKGAKVDIGDWNTDARSSYQVYGEIVATNLTESGSGDRYMSWTQGATTPGVFKFESVTNAMTGNWWWMGDQNTSSKHVFYIGAGGLNFSGTAATYCIGNMGSGNHETIRPWYSNFTIAARSDGGRALVFRDTVEFCTDDESGTGRMITIDAVTRGSSSPKVIVSGSGTLKVNRPAINDAQPSVTVTDTATLEYAADGTLGTGAVTLGAGTTLVKTANKLEVGALQLDGDGIHTLELGPTAAMEFADSSAKAWSGTLLIKGFRDGAVRFGDSEAALTEEQVKMIRAEKPDGSTMRLHISSAGYLAPRGMMLVIQ